ncbi:hypothetical protein [Paraburkholderia pallida]|uniref:OmpA-like domain-containing protein n=1 Tax=Paraburkholderia pallida TaxID=2547399 RepID=A0A4P7CTW4_9BURK|nr:hypothetical protein [Paraburkholderia pallida]QBQ98226.1 hypothetical protein E1956_14295 [Paraburkholderia pallida]
MPIKFCIFAIALLVWGTSGFACTASENFDIYFAKNSDKIPGSEVLRLANWIVDQKIIYANHTASETTLISGHAEEDEREPSNLARKRLNAGTALLEKLGFMRGEVKTSVRVYSRLDVQNGRRVEISFEPDCPNKCCDGQ